MTSSPTSVQILQGSEQSAVNDMPHVFVVLGASVSSFFTFYLFNLLPCCAVNCFKIDHQKYYLSKLGRFGQEENISNIMVSINENILYSYV